MEIVGSSNPDIRVLQRDVDRLNAVVLEGQGGNKSIYQETIEMRKDLKETRQAVDILSELMQSSLSQIQKDVAESKAHATTEEIIKTYKKTKATRIATIISLILGGAAILDRFFPFFKLDK